MSKSDPSEKELLIKRIFSTPYAGYEDSLTLFLICRELGDPYCLKFNEKGYTEKYESFKSDEVIARAVNLLNDQKLLDFAKKYKDALSGWNKFQGEHYTYDPKTKSLTLQSQWPYLEKKLRSFLDEYGNEGEAVLLAIWEVNTDHGKRYDNYYMIQTLAKKSGLKKGWLKILAELELIEIISRHKGDIAIPEELLPLSTKVLKK